MEDNIIYYDFRYETRREEMLEIELRTIDRLQYFAQNGNLTEEQRKQSELDTKRANDLKLEATVWGDYDFLEEWN